jgi:thiol-disulfide isomerase/thioredoxin
MPQEGEQAIDFTYPDKDGNNFSLASFKGNLVYVDVWATWCGPCKAEIPSLQKLEEEYHGKNITFLSVSVDTDKDAWLKMIAEKQMGGVQLWADGWSEITKSYAIFGIPRFLLFSDGGNVISTNAPRPSSDEIRPLLDENL